MSSSAPNAGARAIGVSLSQDALSVDLADGRTITVPLSWYPRLCNATPAQRANWRLVGGGRFLRWEEVDEDLTVEGLLQGAPAPRGSGRPHS